MYTGIIQRKGDIESLVKNRQGNTEICVAVDHQWHDIQLGESIAFDGICLSITGYDNHHLKAELTPETLDKSLFSKYPKRRVNIERSLSLGDKLGGHMVQGHVDGTVTVQEIVNGGNRYEMVFRYPPELSPYMIDKGSATINGVSLTIFEITDSTFKTALIPDTLKKTNLSELKPGDGCHIESDMIGRFLYRFYSLSRS